MCVNGLSPAEVTQVVTVAAVDGVPVPVRVDGGGGGSSTAGGPAGALLHEGFR